MPKRLSSFVPLARPLLWTLVGALTAFVLWWTPVSPLALARGDVLLGQGDPHAAVAHFDRVARLNPIIDLQRAARRRSADIMRTTLRDPLGARLRIRQIAEDADLLAAERAVAWEQLGELLHISFNDAAGAAGAYRMAYDSAPRDERAADRLVASARATESTGELDDAHHAWDRVARKFPDRRADARLSQASLLLGRGRISQALGLFDKALDADPSPTTRAIAERGAQTCKERLGVMETALAELLLPELPPHLEAIRKAQSGK